MADLPGLVVLAIIAFVAIAVSVRRRPGPSAEATVAAARIHALAVAVAAPVVGLVVAVWLLVAGADPGHGFPGSVGDAAAFAPLAFAVAHTVVLAVGELTWPRPSGAVRRARLVRRRLVDVLPRPMVRLALGATVLLVAELVLGAVASSPDGRSIHVIRGPRGWGHSPWPGPHYGHTLTTELVLLALSVALALWLVVNRPAVTTEDERIETALRRASAHRVLRAPTAALLIVSGVLFAVIGSALAGVEVLPVLAGSVCGLVGLAMGLGGLVVLCWPAPRVPAAVPAAAVG